MIIATIGLLVAAGLSSPAVAADDEAAGKDSPSRPAIKLHRWQEDWSVLADPRLRTGLLDWLKNIPLSSTDPKSYLSFGQTVRERFEFNNAPERVASQLAQQTTLSRR